MKQVLSFFLFAALLAVIPTALNAQFSGINPEAVFYRHNPGPGGTTPVNPNDTLGTISFRGLTALNNVRTGASIRSITNSSVAPGILSGNLVFRTSNGLTGLRNQMIITEVGLVGIGTMTPTFNLDVLGNTHTSGNFFGRIHMDLNEVNSAPNTYLDQVYFEAKSPAIVGVPAGGGTRGGMFSVAPGVGSFDHQLFFDNQGIYHRSKDGDAADWSAAMWYKILTSQNINGTTNFISKFTDPNSIGNSQLFDNGSQVGIGVGASPDAGYKLTVGGDERVNGRLYVTGSTETDGNFRTGGNADVDGNANVDGGLTVTNATSTGSLTVTNATNTGSLSVTTNASVGNNLTVTNNASIGNNLSVTNDADINNNLNVDGTTRLVGKVAIGPGSVPTTGSPSHSLYVGGSILTEEVKVELKANWPDYVFNQPVPDPLEWEKYINANKHLPGIPSAQEIEAEGGYYLGETQRILVEKVEQLTLMLIEQQKQILALQQELKACKQ